MKSLAIQISILEKDGRTKVKMSISSSKTDHQQKLLIAKALGAAAAINARSEENQSSFSEEELLLATVDTLENYFVDAKLTIRKEKKPNALVRIMEQFMKLFA